MKRLWEALLIEDEKERRKMSRNISHKASLVFWHKCDICGNGSYAIYIPQLDKWYCVDCIQIACELLNKYPPCNNAKV